MAKVEFLTIVWNPCRADNMTRNRIFISYSHQDEKLFREFLVHLKPWQDLGIVDVWTDKAISGNELTCLTAEWSMVFPPFAKGGEGGFEPQGLTPPVKIPPNPPFSKGGDPARFDMIFSGNHLSARSWEALRIFAGSRCLQTLGHVVQLGEVQRRDVEGFVETGGR
jgi:hypothetical protein